MKAFIVFLGLLLIHVSFLSYQGDMARYVQSQNYLKALAEECSAGAALYYDEEAYSFGNFYFNYDECQDYIQYVMEESKEKMPLPKSTVLLYEVSFQDDSTGYEDENIPSVTVSLTAETEDLFHLPFLEVTQVKRAAKYELPQ